jgi:hypothetical protein
MAPVKRVDNLVDISVDNFVDYFSSKVESGAGTGRR